jgi:peptidylprolyl isomerase
MSLFDAKDVRCPVCARILPALLAVAAAAVASGATAQTAKPKTMTEVLAASKPSDWRELDPQRTLYLELNSGRVILELAPQFAPTHVANVIALVREGYFDGLAVMRSQDNYVVQWGDADGKRQIKTAKRTLPAEFERSSKDLPFTMLPDQDTYAPEVGFSEGFPAARDPALGRVWPVHCYGMVGAGRDEDVDSGGGTELYAVTGHSPRHLDRNVTLLGRVVKGMDLLSSLPRGTAELGFYEKPEQRVPIRTVRMAVDVPEAERTRLSVLRTDTQTFMDLVESRRNRRDPWFKVPAGRIEICNVPIPVR